MTEPGWTEKLADGLVMRGAVAEDADRLADYNAKMHREPEFDIDAFWIGAWTRDLLTKPHPTTSLDDIIVVEDPSNRKIVSSTVYFSQTWSYAGVSIPFGRPEIVSTHPDYRNRGLVREQFRLMHEWGDQRGHLVQGITGIPYYYRQFGYEMALDMPVPVSAQIDQLPGWKEDEAPDIQLRSATRDDVELIEKTYRLAQARSLFSPELDSNEFGYLLFERDKRSALHAESFVVEDAAANAIGHLRMKTVLPMEQAEISVMEFSDVSIGRMAMPSLLKALRSRFEQTTDESGKRVKKLVAFMPKSNPAHLHLSSVFSGSGRPYAWYIRMPDIPALLTAISSVLAQRLVGTAHDGYTGEFLISFYRDGLNLWFDSGTLVGVEKVSWPDRKAANARFPDLTFLQMLCGRKSLAELHSMFIDCSAKSEADASFLETLFPKKDSDTVFAVA